jgi:uncharacterized protein with PIN domain
MVKCPRCGTEIERPMKEWNMIPHSESKPKIHVKHYRCPQCNKTFRLADKIIPTEIGGSETAQ